MYAVKSKAVQQGMLAALAAVALGAPAYGAGLEGLGGVKASGYVEGQYTYNFDNDPATNANALRVFDTTANSFTINMAELVLSKSTDSGMGFGLVLNYGLDADTLATDTSADLFVQQAYVTDKAFGDAVELKFGKFATLHGAEVIEGPANYNISRSFLFGYAIPFTHTGLRFHSEMGSGLSGHLGINNGWDNDSDNNTGKSVELQVGLAPTDMLSLSVTGMYGPESTVGAHHDNRGLVDVVATIKPMDGVAVVLNYDRGSQAAAAGPGTAGDLWQGYAIYANLGLGDKHSVTLRGEVFDDQDGARTGSAQTLREVTLTFACKMKENLEWRAEFRHDGSDGAPFTDEDGAATGNQNTAAIAAYYSF
ncbi:MAG: outer membrane beta-barrel protein [Nitrospirota bacterium]